ncbi:MAG TPA: hypothetical protein VN720_09240, partial [Rudaea sp.]|nr:hypothetical protein [Rudaea sp.]
PRSALAHSQGRMPGERITGGVFLWLPFFAQALRRRSGANSAAGRVAAKGRMPGVKKVTRSPAGRVEALHLRKEAKNCYSLCWKDEQKTDAQQRDRDTIRTNPR